MRVAAIKSASTIRKISSFSMSVVSAGREELDLLACGAMCSSVLVCNTSVQSPKYKFQGLWSFYLLQKRHREGMDRGKREEAAIKSASAIQRHKLNLVDLLACGAMCSSVLKQMYLKKIQSDAISTELQRHPNNISKI